MWGPEPQLQVPANLDRLVLTMLRRDQPINQGTCDTKFELHANGRRTSTSRPIWTSTHPMGSRYIRRACCFVLPVVASGRTHPNPLSLRYLWIKKEADWATQCLLTLLKIGHICILTLARLCLSPRSSQQLYPYCKAVASRREDTTNKTSNLAETKRESERKFENCRARSVFQSIGRTTQS